MKSYDQTNALYNRIYKNAAMGMGTTTHLLSGKRGKEMEESLKKQQAEYAAICRSAEQSLRDRGAKVKGLTTAQKLRTDGAVSLNLLRGRSDSHVAQMLMTGSAMGVINAQKQLNEYPEAEGGARDLMQRLSDFEQGTIEKMKPFL